MGFVLDASIVLSLCFKDEATPATNKLLLRLEKQTAHVPSLFSLELGNILITAERKKRITYAGITEFLSLITNLDVQVDHETATKAFHETLGLAYAEKLTTYDAAYLELAMRLGCPLATKDHQLQKAAKHLGVKLI